MLDVCDGMTGFWSPIFVDGSFLETVVVCSLLAASWAQPGLTSSKLHAYGLLSQQIMCTPACMSWCHPNVPLLAQPGLKVPSECA